MRKPNTLVLLMLQLALLLAEAGRCQFVQLELRKTITIPSPVQPEQPHYAAIAVNARHDIYLADVALNRILRIDSTGHLLREVGGFGWNPLQFDRPLDIWAGNALDVFVADYNNHRIQRFDRALNFVTTIDNDPARDERLQFGFPVAVTYSRFGELFIVEQEHRRLVKFDGAGRPTASFGDYDWGAGTLREPVALAISPQDEVFVADVARRAVIRFDYYGNFLQEILLDSIAQPIALAAGNSELCLLAGQPLQLLLFDFTGTVIATVHLKTDPFALHEATDVAITGSMLYILDGVAGKITSYHLKYSSR